MLSRKLVLNAIVSIFLSCISFHNSCALPETQEVSFAVSSSLEQLLTSIGYSKISLIKKNGALYAHGIVAKQPVYFLIDTGSVGASILSDGLELLQLVSIESEDKVANMTGNVTNVFKVVLPQVEIGGIELGHMHAKVMHQPFKNDAPTIILGNEFLQNFYALIDTGGHALYISQKSLSRQSQFKVQQLLRENQYESFPLTQLSSGHLIMPVQIDENQSVNFLFDTGTSHTTLSNTYARFLEIIPIAPFQTQDATDGTITFAEINLEKVTFNPLQIFFKKPLELKNVEAVSANMESMTQFLGVVGVLGMSDMIRLNTIISMPSQSVFFVP